MWGRGPQYAIVLSCCLAASCGRCGFDYLASSDGSLAGDGALVLDGASVDSSMLLDGPSGARVFPDPTLCDSSSWLTTLRYGGTQDSVQFHPENGCFAELAAKSFGTATISPTQTAAFPLLADDWVCVDYETLVASSPGGACELCTGASGLEGCVFSGAVIAFRDASDVYLGGTWIGESSFMIADGDGADALQGAPLASDGTTYESWTCLNGNEARRFLDFDAPSFPARHRFRGRLLDLTTGGTPAAFQFSATSYYGGSPSLTVRIHDFFIGDVSSEAFCTCLGQTWSGSSCSV
jgi:hypothetical protein